MDLKINHPSFKVEYLAPDMKRAYVCIHISSLKGFCVRERVRVYNILRGLNHKLNLLVELVPTYIWYVLEVLDYPISSI